MDTETPPKSKAAVPAVRGDTGAGATEIETTFRIFAARLSPATYEALRARLSISRSELDDRRKQTDFLTALRELR